MVVETKVFVTVFVTETVVMDAYAEGKERDRRAIRRKRYRNDMLVKMMRCGCTIA